MLLSLLVAAGVFIFWLQFRANRQPAQSVDDVTAIESRLTFQADDHRNLSSIDRRAAPEVWFRVTLNHAPLGERLSLHCDWINPQGQIVHQNRYRTRVIDKEVWPTHARYAFGPESTVGKWTVRLLLDGRALATATLDVRDGEGENAAPVPMAEKVGDQ